MPAGSSASGPGWVGAGGGCLLDERDWVRGRRWRGEIKGWLQVEEDMGEWKDGYGNHTE